ASHKSKEDDVSKISTSIFITNFPVTFSAKDLLMHVNNMDMSSMRISHLRRSEGWKEKDMGQSGVGNSYVQVVKGNNTSVVAESDHTPTLVLDDECLNTSDLSNSLMGRVKEFASLSNLKMVLHKEGFSNITNSVYGVELWLIQASKDFTIEGRIVWVEIEDENCFSSEKHCAKRRWLIVMLMRRFKKLVDSECGRSPGNVFEERSQNYNKKPKELYTGLSCELEVSKDEVKRAGLRIVGNDNGPGPDGDSRWFLSSILRRRYMRELGSGEQVKLFSRRIGWTIVHEFQCFENQDLYPRIYALETCKFVKVGTKLTQSSLDFSFRRKPKAGCTRKEAVRALFGSAVKT
ncbi:hypothetical protein Tco_1031430, partial [Tanacetum coccineum]